MLGASTFYEELLRYMLSLHFTENLLDTKSRLLLLSPCTTFCSMFVVNIVAAVTSVVSCDEETAKRNNHVGVIFFIINEYWILSDKSFFLSL